jgi:hypothetical protein
MTVWELLDYLAKKNNKSPIRIQMHRGTGKPDVTAQDFSKSLH